MSRSSNGQELSSMTFEQYFKSLKILHFAMCMGSILTFGVILYTLGLDKLTINDINFTYASIGFMGIVSLSIVSRTIVNNRNKSLLMNDSLSQKLHSYRSNKILTFAALEGPTLICIILGFIFSEAVLFILAALSIIYLVSLRPNKNKILESLPISIKEKKYFNSEITLKQFEDSLRNNS